MLFFSHNHSQEKTNCLKDGKQSVNGTIHDLKSPLKQHYHINEFNQEKST